MSERTESDARVGRVLSAALQAVLAEQMTGSQDAASSAFLREFEDDMAAAARDGSRAVLETYADLFADVSGAIFAVTKHVAQTTGGDPVDLLKSLIRTCRRVERS